MCHVSRPDSRRAGSGDAIHAGHLSQAASESVSWAAPRRAWKAGVWLCLAALSATVAAWPTELAAAHPVLRTLQASGAVVYATNAIAQLRTRLILEDEGLVIARALRRTRIPWADVREVRVRGLDLGRRGWIEVVRQNGREVFLPAPVEAFPLLQERWQRTAGVLATSHSPADPGAS